MLRDFICRFRRDRKGNVAIIFALSLVPCIFLVGMGIDFGAAMQRRARLNAAADAAALAAVTPSMMNQSDAQAITTAQNVFTGQASAVTGVNYNTPTVTVTHNGLARVVNVSYNASSNNAFPNVLGWFNKSNVPTWAINGSSQSSSTVPPNINFWLLLDNSPSMALAATTSGIYTMIQNTLGQNDGNGNLGCAFACHETNPAAGDVAGNPFVSGNSGPRIDNYTLAKQLNVVTRIQNVAYATQSLMTTANNMETTTNSQFKIQYQTAVFTFANAGIVPIFPTTGCSVSSCTPSTDLLGAGSTAKSDVDVIEVCSNNSLGPWDPVKKTCTNGNSDEDTDFDHAMSQMNGLMPNPGTGSSTSTPQEILFIVTDGVEDKLMSTSWGANGNCTGKSTGSRCHQPFDNTWCTTVKNRGIFIAILYTEYLPLPPPGLPSNEGGDWWYSTYVSPYQTQIGPNLQNCASPGLYFMVTTDQDITSAMSNLFQAAVATARLTQ